MLPSEFIGDFFSASTGSIFFCSIGNERNGARPAEVCGRGGGDRLDELVLHRWDKPDRGTFFACNTMRPAQARRSKELVHEIVCLHADIDFAKVDMEPDTILVRLGQLPCLPSKIVNSGHGHHCYWLLNEAEAATPELISRVESLLRKLADVIGGDPACAEVARLMRLPGSYNTKNGDRILVQVIVDRPLRYELDDLDEWLSEAGIFIPRKGAAPNDSNPFLTVRMPGVGGPAVDVSERLAAMQFQGAGNASIHSTQVSVTAAMLNQGISADEVVAKVLAATRIAAGDAGSRWNWDREEKNIRAMCASWAQKSQGAAGRPAGATMEQLGTMEFQPVSFLVPGLIPSEGVCLLASKPKVGKSWLLFDLCISSAMGRDFLGGRQPAQGHTLYLALEDSLRRLRSRGEKLLTGHFGPWPSNMTVGTTWERADQGGLERIRDWIMGVRAAGGAVSCIAIDVLKQFRPAGQEKKTVYDRDYESLVGLRTLSHELGVAIVVSHHTRKTASEDLLDLVSGTLGLSGSADTVIVIDRQPSGGFVFDFRGRDVEGTQLAASLDKGTCRWSVSGDAVDVRRSEAQRAVREVLRTAPEGMSPAEIAAASDLKPNTVRGTLARMVRDGEVKKVGSKYRLPV
jgi:hypothetical protein